MLHLLLQLWRAAAATAAMACSSCCSSYDVLQLLQQQSSFSGQNIAMHAFFYMKIVLCLKNSSKGRQREKGYTKTTMANKLNTYTQGFEIKAPTAITKDGMLRLCRALDLKFGKGNTFKPEGISDGFIPWANLPCKMDAKTCKCVRLSG